MTNVVEMRKITKIFPGVVANDNIDFELKKGEIHVLLGENGAGKTTLMNILYGLYNQTSGDIYINGRKSSICNPKHAIENGIGMVHQHFMLVQPFTVTENIILGSEIKKGIKLDMETSRRKVSEISEKFGLYVDTESKIQDISVGMQQRVEILKTLFRGADILILDEPTAVLTPQEIEELGMILKKLSGEGKSIILITHKLKEVMEMSDRVTVIRRGKLINTVKTSDTSVDELAEMMVGRKVNLKVDKKNEEISEKKILEIKDLSVLDNRMLAAVDKLSLDIKKGEIYAVAGVDGNGQKELVEAITGLRKVEKGKILLDNEDITDYSAKKVIRTGVGHIPQDRQKRGLVLQHDLAENMVLGYHYDKPFNKKGIVQYDKIHEHAKRLINEFDIRTPDENVTAKSLSGGNQQKVIVAREFHKDMKLLVAAQPTRGLDIGAIEFVHKKIVEARDNGIAVLLVSLELDEVLSLADRIGVIYDGKIVGEMDAKEATEKKLGIMMAGGKSKEENTGDKDE